MCTVRVVACLTVLSTLVACGGGGGGDGGRDSCDVHTVKISWPTFLVSDGSGYSTTSSCEGIESVKLTLDDTTSYDLGCSDEPEIPFFTGHHTIRVEAMYAHQPVYRAEVEFSAEGCADQVVTTQPGEGAVILEPSACAGGGASSSLELSLLDEVSSSPVTEAGVNPSLPCATEVAYHLPAGSYRLSWIEERVLPTLDLVGAQCTAKDFEVVAGADTSLPVQIPSSTEACPPG